MEDYSQSLKDKNIIVTGANTGIGYEAALDFAKRGANLILACRNEKLGDEAVGKIKADSKNDNVQLELLDLSSLANTRAFAQRITLVLQVLITSSLPMDSKHIFRSTI